MSSTTTDGIPPLYGDENGIYRIRIIGNSGKPTLSGRLSHLLGIPAVNLDTLHWRPDWQEAPDDEMKADIQRVIEANPQGWILDGNYTRILGDFALGHVTDIVFLDPPFWVYFPRLMWRTFKRLFRIAPPCAPGCEETFHEVFFSKLSILRWAWDNHGNARERGQELMKVHESRVHRLGGWGGETERWIQEVEELVRKA
ncbi:hypothetical protein CYLTODRAFT_388960 [Cylindrobasidium torrendii FP15055 ss-10]|uniref:Adenylate kinase n=1 Tax=Cylindrobasidium torrendii FP15055 ss-10 TaxID=1314674 RepID=A0A0D7BP41_9AGAR|nr:hypothetical protein CYLTODRAFT_388960 [Cylindrobasidium torrendii FP15055 ss-10]